MKIADLVHKLEGIHTLDSIASTLKVDKRTAANYISKLRKQGFIKTKRTSSGKRIYNISKLNILTGKSYYEVLNKISPTKISESEIYKIYGREITLEETLIYAIKTEKLRVILASLALFKQITNWTLLSELARKNKIQRQVCALYDLARSIIKVKKMSQQFKNTGVPKVNDAFVYLIDKLESKDFGKIQEKWKVYLPFNMADLQDYTGK